MHDGEINRRRFAAGAGVAVAGASLASGAAALPGAAPAATGISLDHAAIHQEIVFAAGPARIWRTLTRAEEFDRVVRASAAAATMMKADAPVTPTRIDARPGGAFALFGGYVTGFNLELVANERLVQAWRAGSWAAGLFSIARFVLAPQGEKTRLTFDHTGFPDEAAGHLATGWHINYWEPMAKVLA